MKSDSFPYPSTNTEVRLHLEDLPVDHEVLAKTQESGLRCSDASHGVNRSSPLEKTSTKHPQREQVLSWLAENTPQPRIQHILRVEQTATQLADAHHLSPEKAAQAGLLHDLAKYFKPARLLEIAREKGLEITSVDEANPHLLHADVSAVIARDRFGVQDPEILAAIANHTLGRPGMDLLSCVVFLADSVEPGRGNSPELELIRQAGRNNLYQAVWLNCDRTLKHLIETHSLIHPRMVLTRNWALEMS